jgi:hypothetical protein
MIQQYNINLLKILEQSDLFKSYALPLIKDCFKYNGYLAGGFVRKLLLIHNKQFTLEQLEQEYKNWNYVHDIDFFFEDDIDLQKFYLKHIMCFSDLTLNTYEQRRQTLKFQMIRTFIGKPIDVISSFDMINVMVALKNDTVYVHDDWSKYEKLKQVHVVNWHNSMIVRRLGKYVAQKLSLSPETQRILPHAIITFIEQQKIHHFSEIENKCSYDQLTTHVRNMIINNQITNVNDLLLLASLHLKIAQSYNRDLKLNDLIMQKLMNFNKIEHVSVFEAMSR